jgi:hypothetical protein
MIGLKNEQIRNVATISLDPTPKTCKLALHGVFGAPNASLVLTYTYLVQTHKTNSNLIWFLK